MHIFNAVSRLLTPLHICFILLIHTPDVPLPAAETPAVLSPVSERSSVLWVQQLYIRPILPQVSDYMKIVRTKACLYPWVWWVCSWADYQDEQSSFPQHSGFPSPSHPSPHAPPQRSSPKNTNCKVIVLKTSKMYIIWLNVCVYKMLNCNIL